MSTQLPLLVFKSGKHYDGLIRVNNSNRGFSNDINVNLMTGTPECSESAAIYSIEECRFIDTLTDRELKWLTPNHVTSQVKRVVIIAKTTTLMGWQDTRLALKRNWKYIDNIA